MMGTPWTNEEKKLLIELWQTDMSVREFYDRFPGRTWRAVESYGRVRLGFGPRNRWTPDEERILKEIWSQPGTIKSKLHLLPGRTLHSCFTAAGRLGLTTARGHLRYETKSALQIAIEQQLKKGEALTSRQLSTITRGSEAHIRRILANGHMKREYRVAKWIKRSPLGPYAAMYLLGHDADAPYPEPKGSKKCDREAHQRKVGKTSFGNPFLVAAGLISAPEMAKGRVFKQSMSIHDEEELAA